MRQLILVVGVMLTLAAGGVALAITPEEAGVSDAPIHKVFVCKYVGTPGDDERLQTGDNPISVDTSALKNFVTIGAFFNDEQGRSVAIAFDTGQPEPSPDECPGGDGTTTTSSTSSTTTSSTTTSSTTTTTTCPDCGINTVVIIPSSTTTTTLPPGTPTQQTVPTTVPGATTTTVAGTIPPITNPATVTTTTTTPATVPPVTPTTPPGGTLPHTL